ncbi:MAG: SDR family NAD(P)-dependent oxidoreductase, partial [Comamonas sp.]
MQISEQQVLVTGGARGLGAHISRAVAREGAGVVINYHRSDKAAAALAEELGPRAMALQADVTDAAAVQRLVRTGQEHTGRAITSVVNNALTSFAFDGDARPKLDAISWERFSQQFE